MNNPKINIDYASVKVMRSHDYCHFEVSLSTTLDSEAMTEADQNEAVDDLRKRAARLADKAVKQYQEAKRIAGLKENLAGRKWHLDEALACPENERRPEQKAIIKYHSDANFAAQFDYDYDDNWEEPV